MPPADESGGGSGGNGGDDNIGSVGGGGIGVVSGGGTISVDIGSSFLNQSSSTDSPLSRGSFTSGGFGGSASSSHPTGRGPNAASMAGLAQPFRRSQQQQQQHQQQHHPLQALFNDSSSGGGGSRTRLFAAAEASPESGNSSGFSGNKGINSN